jgi:RNA polymerase sigma-54 factor
LGLSARLQLRQSQSLVMTPQLMQSIRLLQMAYPELERFIDEEIERNPLLERPQEEQDAAAPLSGLPADSASAEGEWQDREPEWSAREMSQRLDASLENLFPDDPGVREGIGPELAAQWKSAAVSAGARSGAADGFDPDDLAAGRGTLRDHLAEEIALAFRKPSERAIALDLADSLDDNGYLRAGLHESAERLGVEESEVAAVLAICRTFDPPGIFARSLGECLALQLDRRDRLDPAMKVLLENLDLLARRDFQALRKRCGVDDDDLLDMMAEIRSLDPKPGTAFTSTTSDFVVPDVVVRPAHDGSWQVELNPETLPRVLVDRTYYAQVSAHARSQDERDFLAECLQNANWLTRSLDQRARTILKVTSEIVRQQDGFLALGVRHLRPLNLKAVAEAAGLHESTVSRVTANKYMLTPRGTFELRYFFTAAIASAEGGDAHSSEAVRDRIRQLISEEKPADILSDDTIVAMLRQGGVDIARRTVAKYREGMNIPSSVQRRREKRALASLGR